MSWRRDWMGDAFSKPKRPEPKPRPKPAPRPRPAPPPRDDPSESEGFQLILFFMCTPYVTDVLAASTLTCIITSLALYKFFPHSKLCCRIGHRRSPTSCPSSKCRLSKWITILLYVVSNFHNWLQLYMKRVVLKE